VSELLFMPEILYCVLLYLSGHLLNIECTLRSIHQPAGISSFISGIKHAHYSPLMEGLIHVFSSLIMEK